MTRDFLGNEIKIGDKVVAMRYRGTSALLYEGIVEKVSPKTVCVKKKYKGYDWGMYDVMRVDSGKVVVINDIAIKEEENE